MEFACGQDLCLCLTLEGDVWLFGNTMCFNYDASNCEKLCNGLVLKDPFLKNIVKIFSGSTSCFAISSSKQIFAFGLNFSATLGIPLKEKKDEIISKPTLIQSLASLDIVQISSRHNHTLFLDRSGTRVFSCGNNVHGECGLGFESDALVQVPTPVLLPENSRIKMISSGAAHSLLLSDTGAVYAFGSNNFYELAINTLKNVCTPTRVIALQDEFITTVCANFYNSFALSVQGTVLAWGELDNNVDSSAPKSVVTVPVKLSDTIFSTPTRIIDISGGRNHMTMLSDTGKVFNCGLFLNHFVQYWRTSEQENSIEIFQHYNIMQIESGADFSIILCRRGQVHHNFDALFLHDKSKDFQVSLWQNQKEKYLVNITLVTSY